MTRSFLDCTPKPHFQPALCPPQAHFCVYALSASLKMFLSFSFFFSFSFALLFLLLLTQIFNTDVSKRKSSPCLLFAVCPFADSILSSSWMSRKQRHLAPKNSLTASDQRFTQPCICLTISEMDLFITEPSRRRNIPFGKTGNQRS